MPAAPARSAIEAAAGPLGRSSPALDRLGVTLRGETEEDRDWLAALHAATRADEMARLPWPEAVKAAFLAEQFRLQQDQYRARMPDADRLVVLRGGTPVGQLRVDRTAVPWRLVDVAIAPAARGGGIGAALVRLLQRQARAVGIDLHVAHGNARAAALYARLGFVRVESASATHHRMLWPGRRPLN